MLDQHVAVETDQDLREATAVPEQHESIMDRTMIQLLLTSLLT